MHYNLSEEQKLFLHISYSMLEEGYDVDQIMEFWNLKDESKIKEICESITLSETIDTSNPDFLLICEKINIKDFLARLFGRFGKARLRKPPTQTKGGRPITQSGQKPPQPANKPPTGSSVTGAKPTLTQRVKDAIPSKIKSRIKKGGAVAAGAGLITLGGKLAMDNNIIPGAPESKPTEDPSTTDSNPNPNPNEDPDKKPPSPTNGNSSDDPTNTSLERKQRNYAWASINNRPANFYRNDPAYYHTKSKYRNIRGNPVPPQFARDHYEVIADYLIAEGHASDIEEADYVMRQLDEEFIRSIIENN